MCATFIPLADTYGDKGRNSYRQSSTPMLWKKWTLTYIRDIYTDAYKGRNHDPLCLNCWLSAV